MKWTNATLHANATTGFGIVLWRKDPDEPTSTFRLFGRHSLGVALGVLESLRRSFGLGCANPNEISAAFEAAARCIVREGATVDDVELVRVTACDRDDSDFGELEVLLLSDPETPVHSFVVSPGNFEPRRLADWIACAFGWRVFLGSGVIVE